jgi:hypothetical protein
MKRSLALCSMVFILCVLATAAGAQEKSKKTDQDKPGKPASAENPQFAALKKLEGTWTGKGGGEMSGDSFTVIYKVTAAGSTVMETLMPGSDHEMVTMYHMDGKDLVMTHYCAMGNQPHMKCHAGGDAKVLTFECDGKGENMKESDPHMHKMVLSIIDDNHIKSHWTSVDNGKTGHEADFDLTRKKA